MSKMKRSAAAGNDSGQKKKRYESKFKKEWETEFPGIVGCSRDVLKAVCTFCNSEISVSHGGKNDLAKHCNAPAHVSAVKEAKQSGKQARITDLRQGGALPTPFADKVSI